MNSLEWNWPGENFSDQGLPMEELLMAASSTKLRWRGPAEQKATSDPGLEKYMKLMELAFRMGQNANASGSPRTPASSASSGGAAPQFPALPSPPGMLALQDGGVDTIYVFERISQVQALLIVRHFSSRCDCIEAVCPLERYVRYHVCYH